MDRAVVEIDEALAPAYEARRAHAEVCLITLVPQPAYQFPIAPNGSAVLGSSRSSTPFLSNPARGSTNKKPRGTTTSGRSLRGLRCVIRGFQKHNLIPSHRCQAEGGEPTRIKPFFRPRPSCALRWNERSRRGKWRLPERTRRNGTFFCESKL